MQRRGGEPPLHSGFSSGSDDEDDPLPQLPSVPADSPRDESSDSSESSSESSSCSEDEKKRVFPATAARDSGATATVATTTLEEEREEEEAVDLPVTRMVQIPVPQVAGSFSDDDDDSDDDFFARRRGDPAASAQAEQVVCIPEDALEFVENAEFELETARDFVRDSAAAIGEGGIKQAVLGLLMAAIRGAEDVEASLCQLAALCQLLLSEKDREALPKDVIEWIFSQLPVVAQKAMNRDLALIERPAETAVALQIMLQRIIKLAVAVGVPQGNASLLDAMAAALYAQDSASLFVPPFLSQYGSVLESKRLCEGGTGPRIVRNSLRENAVYFRRIGGIDALTRKVLDTGATLPERVLDIFFKIAMRVSEQSEDSSPFVPFAEAVADLFRAMPSSQAKTVSVDRINLVAAKIKFVLSGLPDAARRSEKFILDLSSRFLESDVVEVRVKGVSLLVDLATRAELNSFSILDRVRYNRATEWLTLSVFISHLKESGILRAICSGDVHEEVLKHSIKLFAFLCNHNAFGAEEVDMLWDVVRSSHHEVVKEVVFSMLYSFAREARLSTKCSEHIISQIEQHPPSETSPRMLELAKEISFTSIEHSDRVKSILLRVIADDSGSSPELVARAKVIFKGLLGVFTKLHLELSAHASNLFRGKQPMLSLFFIRTTLSWITENYASRIALSKLVRNLDLLRIVKRDVLSFAKKSSASDAPEQLRERLDTLFSVVSADAEGISQEDIQELWAGLCDDGFHKEFFSWLARLATISGITNTPILSLEQVVFVLDLFQSRFGVISASLSAFNCFLQFFFARNVFMRTVILPAQHSFIIHWRGEPTPRFVVIGWPLKMLETIWAVAVRSPVAEVSSEAVDVLIEAHNMISSLIVEDAVSIRQQAVLKACEMLRKSAAERDTLSIDRLISILLAFSRTSADLYLPSEDSRLIRTLQSLEPGYSVPVYAYALEQTKNDIGKAREIVAEMDPEFVVELSNVSDVCAATSDRRSLQLVPSIRELVSKDGALSDLLFSLLDVEGINTSSFLELLSLCAGSKFCTELRAIEFGDDTANAAQWERLFHLPSASEESSIISSSLRRLQFSLSVLDSVVSAEDADSPWLATFVAAGGAAHIATVVWGLSVFSMTTPTIAPIFVLALRQLRAINEKLPDSLPLGKEAEELEGALLHFLSASKGNPELSSAAELASCLLEDMLAASPLCLVSTKGDPPCTTAEMMVPDVRLATLFDAIVPHAPISPTASKTLMALAKDPMTRRWLFERFLQRSASTSSSSSSYFELDFLAEMLAKFPDDPIPDSFESFLLSAFLRCSSSSSPECENPAGLLRLMAEFVRHSRETKKASKLCDEREASKLVRIVFWSFLFLPDDDKEESSAKKQVRCRTLESRKAAFELLAELSNVSRSVGISALECVGAHVEQHISCCSRSASPPSLELRASCGLCGLRNYSWNCFANAVLQQLFMAPRLRALVLQSSPTSEARDEPLLQLQRLFAWMSLSKRKACEPLEFCKSVLEADELNRQQDAPEFLQRVETKLEPSLKGTPQEKLFEDEFAGSLLYESVCKAGHRSSSEQKFFSIEIEVKGKRTLEQALQAFVSFETIDRFSCAECAHSIEAKRTTRIKTLGNTLVVHLKLFEYQISTMQRRKLSDRLSIPMKLDVRPFLVPPSADGSWPADRTNGCSYIFDLVGVLVHNGASPDSGHYLSLARERDTGRWLRFNDSTVDEIPESRLQNEFYNDVENRSVYMLFYERSSVSKLRSSEASAVSSLQAEEVLRDNEALEKQAFLQDPAYSDFALTLLDRLLPLLSGDKESDAPLSLDAATQAFNIVGSEIWAYKAAFTFAFDMVAAQNSALIGPWKSLLARVLERSLLACQCLILLSIGVFKKSWLVSSLLEARDASARGAFSELLVIAINRLLPSYLPLVVPSEGNAERLSKIAAIEREIAETQGEERETLAHSLLDLRFDSWAVRDGNLLVLFVLTLVQALREVPQSIRRSAQFFSVLRAFAGAGPQPRHLLISLGALGQLIDLYLGSQSPLRNPDDAQPRKKKTTTTKKKKKKKLCADFEVRDVELGPLVELFSLLVRSSNVSILPCKVPSPGALSVLDGSAITLAPLDGLSHSMLRTSEFFFALAILGHHPCASAEIIQHFIWENLTTSFTAMNGLYTAFRIANEQQLESVLIAIEAAVLLHDSREQWRSKLIVWHLGKDVREGWDHRFRYTGPRVLGFLLELAKKSKYACFYFNFLKSEWKSFLSLLDERIASIRRLYYPFTELDQTEIAVLSTLRDCLFKFWDTDGGGLEKEWNMEEEESQKVAGWPMSLLLN